MLRMSIVGVDYDENDPHSFRGFYVMCGTVRPFAELQVPVQLILRLTRKWGGAPPVTSAGVVEAADRFVSDLRSHGFVGERVAYSSTIDNYIQDLHRLRCI